MKLRHRFLGLVCLLSLALPAWAQTYVQPTPKVSAEKGTAIEWLITGVFLVGCLVVAFKPAKRAGMK